MAKEQQTLTQGADQALRILLFTFASVLDEQNKQAETPGYQLVLPRVADVLMHPGSQAVAPEAFRRARELAQLTALSEQILSADQAHYLDSDFGRAVRQLLQDQSLAHDHMAEITYG